MTQYIRCEGMWRVVIGAVLVGRVVSWAGVVPPAIEETVAPGASVSALTEVSTPEIPVNADIVFLADTTTSMSSAIANVKANAATILDRLAAAQPSAQFAVAEYKDVADTAPEFRVLQDLASDLSVVHAGIAAWVLSGGGSDLPEDELNALFQIATGAIAFRTPSTRVVAWFGDAESHDPSNGHTLQDVIGALTTAAIRVVAINVGAGRLDQRGQATAITTATGGTLLRAPTADTVADTILTGLSGLEVTVVPSAVGCGALVVDFQPASQTVRSGASVSFTETVMVPVDASLGGATVECHAEFRDTAGSLLGEQAITIHVPGTCGNAQVDGGEACDPTAAPSGCSDGTICASDCTACRPDGEPSCPVLSAGIGTAFQGGRVQLPIALDPRGVPVAALNFTACYRDASSAGVSLSGCGEGASATSVDAELSCRLSDPPGCVTAALLNQPVVPVPSLPAGDVVQLEFAVPAGVSGAFDVCLDPGSIRFGGPDGLEVCAGQPICGRLDVVAGCIQGDCNCDGAVNAGDRVCLVTKFFEPAQQCTCSCEDCNLSGELNAADAPCITLCAFGQCPVITGGRERRCP